MLSRFLDIPARDEASGLANVLIDTRRGSRNKHKLDGTSSTSLSPTTSRRGNYQPGRPRFNISY